MDGVFGEAKVLLVGAGGIGCEVLKNLVLSGFCSVHVVDLDVIQLSNLNRQFLFKREHIGQPKAKIAADAAALLTPQAKITAHCASITDTRRFPLRLFASFDIVLSALDNIEARRHVNNMCQSARVPLVESGTAGYLGQTSVILPGVSECFDCTPKEKPKTFPTCTIRTTPSTPIHCVFWAKEYLFASLFGAPAEEEPYSDGDENEALTRTWREEGEAFKQIREMAAGDDPCYSHAIFQKVFCTDIAKLLDLGLEEVWRSRAAPVPLSMDLSSLRPWGADEAKGGPDEGQIWPLEKWAALFLASVEKLRLRAFESGFCEQFFDKDDQDAMGFVAAAANIRASIFGIPMNSLFALKSMAGNIIPAIATTNAIVAGMVVLQAMNVLQRESSNCCTAFLTYGVRRGGLFARESLAPPNEECAVCQVHRAVARLDLQSIKLADFISGVLEGYAKAAGRVVLSGELTVIEGSRIIYDPDMEGNSQKTLAQLACHDSTFVMFDFSDNARPLLVALEEQPTLGQMECTFTLLPRNNPRKRSGGEVETVAEAEAVVGPLVKTPRLENGHILVDEEAEIL